MLSLVERLASFNPIVSAYIWDVQPEEPGNQPQYVDFWPGMNMPAHPEHREMERTISTQASEAEVANYLYSAALEQMGLESSSVEGLARKLVQLLDP